MKLNNTVYIVDSSKVISEALALLLVTYDIQVRVFEDDRSFLTACSLADQINCCFLVETQLSSDCELLTLRELRGRGFTMSVIILTDKLTPRIRARALAFGATEVIELPVMNGFLIRRMRELMPSVGGLEHDHFSPLELRDGTQVIIRVMQPGDAAIEQAFVCSLSTESSRMRFSSILKQLSPTLLEKFTNNQYPITYALIATMTENDIERLIAVARYMNTEVEGVAEFAVVVADQYQRLGIASKLTSGIVAAASTAGINRLEGLVLKENRPMLNLALNLGFEIHDEPNDLTQLRVHKNLLIRCAD